MKHELTLVSDGELVDHSLAGERDAYGVLVDRHKGAVCAVAYALTGDFARSEDIAQDAFVSAWKGLPALREKGSFRAWICGMTRRMALNARRKLARCRLEGMSEELPATDELPRDTAISKEESALVWAALSNLEENYREPLVLFYREGRSSAAVAKALGITEDAARQRLSRGRGLLREELAGRIEGVLVRSGPGAGFTAGVLAALPAYAIGVGFAGATSSAAAASLGGSGKAAGGAGLFASLGTLLSGAIGLAGIVLFIRYIRSPFVDRWTRRLILRAVGISTVLSLLFGLWIAWFLGSGEGRMRAMGVEPENVLFVSVAIFSFLSAFMCVWISRAVSRLIEKHPELASKRSGGSDYVSRIRFLGLPLVHVARSKVGFEPGKVRVAKGWIAVGDRAYGGLVALGAVAVAPFALGGLAVGIVPVGGLAFGVLALGGVAAGWMAFGGWGLGWHLAIGGLAIAHDVAIGGLAIAQVAAFGSVVFAPLANSATAWAALMDDAVAGVLYRMLPHAAWLSVLGLPALIFGFRGLRKAREEAAKQSDSNMAQR